MVQYIENFFICKTKIDRSEDSTYFRSSEEYLRNLIRIEELDRDLLTLSQTQTEQGVGESVDPIIKFLVGEPLFIKDDGSPFWKFIGWKSKNLAHIHDRSFFSRDFIKK
jgi:hypothetical protein